VVGAAVAEGSLKVSSPPRGRGAGGRGRCRRRASCRSSRGVLDDIVEGAWVAGAVGEEDDVGVAVEDLLGRRVARDERQLRAALLELPHDRQFDPGVDAGRCGAVASISTAASEVTVLASLPPPSRARPRSSPSPRPLTPTRGRRLRASRRGRGCGGRGARVSMPSIAGTPQSRSQSSQPPSAVAASSPFLPSRMTNGAGGTASDSIAACETP